MSILNKYLNHSVDTIMLINPSLNRADVEKCVKRKIKERLKDPTIIMDNNVNGNNDCITLTKVCSWISDKKPVVSGNATFYTQPSVLVSPTSAMLRTLKKERKEIKKTMFGFLQNDDMDGYAFADLSQLNTKVIMNAEYGGSGAPMAAFYTKYSPPATTLMAQSIITTMAAFFEGYVGDNQKFYSINECIDWMNRIRKTHNQIHDWIVVPDTDEVINRIKSHFIMYSRDDDYVIDNYIKHCNDSELSFIYYANNLKAFIRNHKKIKDLLHNVLSALPAYEAAIDKVPDGFDQFDKVKDYNSWLSHEMFLDPYNPPKNIKDDLHKFIKLINEYVFVEYLTPDSVVKLNNHKRNTVLLVDTDSNVINANIFVSFALDEIFPGETFFRERLYNDMICVNILASILDDGVQRILDYYGRCHNMDKDSRAELTMKNEFMFRRLFLMHTKKRYAAALSLREGNILYPFKTEIKGMDFKKSGVTDDVTEEFTSLLERNILFPDEIKLRDMMKELRLFEKNIYRDLKSGGVTYLKPQSYKPEDAYKKVFDKESGLEISGAWRIPVFRAVTIWNTLNPMNKIYSMDKVKLVKLNIKDINDLDDMQNTNKEMYDNIRHCIFESDRREIRKAGMKIIALPSTMETIPEWLIPYIDYDIIVSDVVASYRSVIEALDIETLPFKTVNGKGAMVSSLISI